MIFLFEISEIFGNSNYLMKKFIITSLSTAFLFNLLCITPPIASAIEYREKILAVQDRKYKLKHELSANIGFLPLDAYNKYFTFGGSYTYNFSDWIAIELGNFSFSVANDTGLERELVRNWVADPVGYDLIKFMINGGIIYTPIYTKLLLFNSVLVRGSTYFILGGGAIKLQTAGTSPEVHVGFGFKVFVKNWFNVRLEIRDFLYKADGWDNALYLGAGFSLNYPFKYELKQ
jgi:outer membrane beta-barrel protein